MTKKSTSFLRGLTCASFVVAGIALIVLTTMQTLQAQVTSQGSTFVQEYIPEEVMLEPAPLHGAAIIEAEGRNVALQIILGMLLILVGFGLHALLVVRNERPVPVHEAKKPKCRGIRIRVTECYWIRNFWP